MAEEEGGGSEEGETKGERTFEGQCRIHIMKGSKAMNRRRWRVLGMFLTIFALGTILLAACTSQGATTNNGVGSTPTNNGGNSGNCTNGAVHTLATTFQESCVNVAKGSSLQV